VIDWFAIIVPLKTLPVPGVAELPTTQKTFFDWGSSCRLVNQEPLNHIQVSGEDSRQRIFQEPEVGFGKYRELATDDEEGESKDDYERR